MQISSVFNDDISSENCFGFRNWKYCVSLLIVKFNSKFESIEKMKNKYEDTAIATDRQMFADAWMKMKWKKISVHRWVNIAHTHTHVVEWVFGCAQHASQEPHGVAVDKENTTTTTTTYSNLYSIFVCLFILYYIEWKSFACTFHICNRWQRSDIASVVCSSHTRTILPHLIHWCGGLREKNTKEKTFKRQCAVTRRCMHRHFFFIIRKNVVHSIYGCILKLYYIATGWLLLTEEPRTIDFDEYTWYHRLTDGWWLMESHGKSRFSEQKEKMCEKRTRSKQQNFKSKSDTEIMCVW